MNKHFNINYADQESEWKDLTIIRLLGEVSDLEDKIDKAIEYIEHKEQVDCNGDTYIGLIDDEINDLLDILKGNDSNE